MVKITKALAKKMYDNGEEIMVIPSRIRPNGMLASWTSKPADDPSADFDKLCQRQGELTELASRTTIRMPPLKSCAMRCSTTTALRKPE